MFSLSLIMSIRAIEDWANLFAFSFVVVVFPFSPLAVSVLLTFLFQVPASADLANLARQFVARFF